MDARTRQCAGQGPDRPGLSGASLRDACDSQADGTAPGLRAGLVAVAALAAADCRAGGARRANAAVSAAGEVVTFPSGARTLHGVVHRPAGAGPFPAVLYNHGSAPGMEPVEAANALGPVFAAHGIGCSSCRSGAGRR